MSDPEPTAVAGLSMHVSTQPYRPPFLQSPGQPPVPWRRWLAMFEDWLLAIGFPETKIAGPRMAALLQGSLGTEGYRIYSSLATDPREAYAAAVARLAAHFGQPASAIFNRAQFTHRQQRPGESITQYVAALKEMAARCEFAAVQMDERVRDQFVAWACSDRIRERLLQEPANRKLEDLVTLALTVERAMSEAPALSSSAHQPSAAVGQVSRHHRRASPSSESGCWNCGQRNHTSMSADCPARGQSCRSCGKSGHFSSKCRSTAKTNQASSRTSSQSDSRRRGNSHHRRRNRSSARTNNINDDIESATDVVNSVIISSIQVGKPGSFKKVICNLAGVSVEFMLDLGAKVSDISRSQYELSLQHHRLQSSDVTLRSYNGQPIPCLGCIKLPVTLDSISLPLFTFSDGRRFIRCTRWLREARGMDFASLPIEAVTSSP